MADQADQVSKGPRWALPGRLAGAAVAMSLLLAPVAGAASYHVQHPARAGAIQSVGCHGATCLAAADGTKADPVGTVIPIKSGKAGEGRPVPGVTFMWGAACASLTYCMAVGENDSVSTGSWNGSTGEGNGIQVGVAVPVHNGHPGSVVTLPSMIVVYGVACPTATLCLVAGEDQPPGPNNGMCCGGIVAITNGHPAPEQRVHGTVLIRGITCPTSSTCLGVAQTYRGGGGIVPIVNGVAGQFEPVPNSHAYGASSALSFIGCATATHCLGTATEATMVISKGHPGDWLKGPRSSDTYGPVSCWNSKSCLTIDALGGNDVHPVSISGKVGRTSYVPMATMYGLACWSPKNCIIGGFDRNRVGHEIAALTDFAPGRWLR